MFSAINRLLKAGRASATCDMLPAELQTVVCSARIAERSSTDESAAPRIMVMTARGSFHRTGSGKEERCWLSANWSNLTEAQTMRALALINARVLEAQREQLSRANGSRWSNWTPLRPPTDRN